MKASAQQALRWAIWILIVVYCAPIVLIGFSYLHTNAFQSSDLALDLFVGLATNSEDSLAILHRVLLPMIGGFAPLAFSDDATNRSAMGLIITLIIGIFASIVVSAAFSSSTVRENLVPHSLFTNLLTTPGSTPQQGVDKLQFEAGLKLIKSFFSRTQESLGMYLMLLFGLKLEKAT